MKKTLALLASILLLTACGGGGGGGSTGTTTTINYTGATTQALLDGTNATEMATGAYNGGPTLRTVSVLGLTAATSANSNTTTQSGIPKYSWPFLRGISKILTSESPTASPLAIQTTTETVAGSCGGSETFNLSIDDATGDFTGSLQFNNYCEEGVTATGNLDISGTADLATLDILQLTMTFGVITLSSAQGSVDMEGTVVASLALPTTNMTLNYRIRDNASAKVYKVDNVRAIIVEEAGWTEESFTSGRYFHPDVGYVEISNVAPFRQNFGDVGPLSGEMLITGNGLTKASLLARASKAFEVTADADANGTFEWTSGILNWANSPNTITVAATTYVQYRTFEDSLNNHHRAWIDYKKNGAPILESDILDIDLFDINDMSFIPAAPPLFDNDTYTVAAWNPTNGVFDGIGEDGHSGFFFDLSNHLSITMGTWTFDTLASNGEFLRHSINFPGQASLVPVASASMSYLWNLDGSLTLSWAEPIDSFEQYRVYLIDASGKDIFYGRIMPGTNQVTLDAALIQGINLTNQITGPTTVTWRMQTRVLDGANNHARSVSNPVVINNWP